MAYLAVFTQEKDGRFSASVPALSGCFSQGNNFEEAKKNIEEAIELYLEGEDSNSETGDEMQIIASIDVKVR